ncbi:MAG: proton-conducting transporter membrane subunit [Anaerolineales bacterium]
MSAPVFVWLILIPLLASPLVYLGGRLSDHTYRWPVAQVLALTALLVTWLPFARTVGEIGASGRMGITLGSVNLCFDGISLLLSAVALGLGSMVVLFSGPYLSGQIGQEKYYAMLTAMIGVMVGLGCACDLFNLWIWFEAMAITSYLLVAFYRDLPESLEAGAKYLVQSATGSVLVVLGISLVLAETGTLNLAEIRALNQPSPLLLAAGGLFIIGFGVKAALVPLHTWLPDAHSQAPSGISAMLSGVVIEAGLIAMLRALSALAGVTLMWGPLLMGFGAVNMLAGNLMAFRQTQIKRLLAYSSLTHVGYMLVGLGVAVYAGQLDGAQGGFFHLFNHGMMKGLAFLAAGALLYALHLASGEHAPLTISDLAGASRKYPLVALTFALAVFALGGIPPLSGFMSKWQIIVSGFETRNLVVVGLVVFAALNSVFSLAYYAPLVNVIYRWQPSLVVSRGRAVPLSLQLPLIGLAILILLAGIWPALVYPLTSPAGSALLAAFGR